MRRLTTTVRTAFRRGIVATTRRASRYDLVLAVIPVTFLAAAVLSAATDVSLRTAVTVASIVGFLAVVDALFLNPPREPAGGRPPA